MSWPRQRAAITRRCDLPIIVDGAVGFGDPVHVTRMMWDLEDAGAAAVELEDQVAPKRVSHHRGIEHMVSDDEMAAKVAAAVAAWRDPNFLVIARTAAVTHEGVDAACRRARAYVDAGADVILVPIPATNDDIAAVCGRGRRTRWRRSGCSTAQSATRTRRSGCTSIR